MINENSKLIEFWNEAFKGLEEGIIEGRFIKEESFDNIIDKYIKDDTKILDFGCGSGWASFELLFRKKNSEIVGVDTSQNAISYLTRMKEINGFNNISFRNGNENLLDEYQDYFNVAVSFNVIDVLNDDVIVNILSKVKKSLKEDGLFLVSINPDFPMELLHNNGYVMENNHLYKDGILRGNIKSKDEWINLFSTYFSFVEYVEFSLSERERKYPRRMFILKK
ncbi:MAG: class I SAM-dependent methyltransferase [Bacilli bacterium]